MGPPPKPTVKSRANIMKQDTCLKQQRTMETKKKTPRMNIKINQNRIIKINFHCTSKNR